MVEACPPVDALTAAEACHSGGFSQRRRLVHFLILFASVGGGGLSPHGSIDSTGSEEPKFTCKRRRMLLLLLLVLLLLLLLLLLQVLLAAAPTPASAPALC